MCIIIDHLSIGCVENDPLGRKGKRAGPIGASEEAVQESGSHWRRGSHPAECALKRLRSSSRSVRQEKRKNQYSELTTVKYKQWCPREDPPARGSQLIAFK